LTAEGATASPLAQSSGLPENTVVKNSSIHRLGPGAHAGAEGNSPLRSAERVPAPRSQQLSGKRVASADQEQHSLGRHPDPVGDPEQRRQHRVHRRCGVVPRAS